MPVPVMHIRKMSMTVAEWFMVVQVVVRRVAVPGFGVGMLMVCIMAVPVAMAQGGVLVRVGMALAQVQPEAECHQQCGRPEQGCGGFMKHPDRQRRPHKRRCAEVSAGAGRAQTPQRQHKQRQADAVAQKPDQQHRQQHNRWVFRSIVTGHSGLS